MGERQGDGDGSAAVAALATRSRPQHDRGAGSREEQGAHPACDPAATEAGRARARPGAGVGLRAAHGALRPGLARRRVAALRAGATLPGEYFCIYCSNASGEC